MPLICQKRGIFGACKTTAGSVTGNKKLNFGRILMKKRVFLRCFYGLKPAKTGRNARKTGLF